MIHILELNFKNNDEIDTIFPVLLEDENDMVLIDCGYPNFFNLIKNYAQKNNINLNKLSKIIITHHDFDHIGSLAEFKRNFPNVEILSSSDEKPYINGNKKSLRLQQAENIFKSLSDDEKKQAKAFHYMLKSIENCDVDTIVKDKEILNFCGKIEVISTPGHMPGHISLYHIESKSLITADALVLQNGVLDIAMPKYTLDLKEAKNSIKKFLNYDIKRVICYHGGVYDKKDIKESFKKIFNI